MHYSRRMLSIMCNNIYIIHHNDGHYCGVIATAFNINTMGKWTLSEHLKLKKCLVENIMFISGFMLVPNELYLSIMHQCASCRYVQGFSLLLLYLEDLEQLRLL